MEDLVEDLRKPRRRYVRRQQVEEVTSIAVDPGIPTPCHYCSSPAIAWCCATLRRVCGDHLQVAPVPDVPRHPLPLSPVISYRGPRGGFR